MVFGTDVRESAAMAGAVAATVSLWRSEARALGLTQSAAIDRIASAFEHADLNQAVRFNMAS